MANEELDALLVGELYGELTPADAARLAELRRTGVAAAPLSGLGALRGQFAVALEDPPARVTQALLQAAHTDAQRADGLGARMVAAWRAMTDALIGHPALAAAATVALVAGVAGTWLVKTGGQVQLPPESMPGPAATSPPAPAPAIVVGMADSDERKPVPRDVLNEVTAVSATAMEDRSDEKDGAGRTRAQAPERRGEKPSAVALDKAASKDDTSDLPKESAKKRSDLSNAETIGWMKEEQRYAQAPSAQAAATDSAPTESAQRTKAPAQTVNKVDSERDRAGAEPSSVSGSAGVASPPTDDADAKGSDPLAPVRAALKKEDCSTARQRATTAYKGGAATMAQINRLAWSKGCSSPLSGAGSSSTAKTADKVKSAPVSETASQPAKPTTK